MEIILKVIKNKIAFLLPLMLLLLVGGCNTGETGGYSADKFDDVHDGAFNFILASDLGRNGYYDQKPVALEMGLLAERIDIEFVAVAGDLFHHLGLQSVSDPLWMTNFELIYDHPELQIEWYPVPGNHEYRGNVQAGIDYSNISRRWNMPDRYYTRSFEIEDDATFRVVFIDTPPLMDKYRYSEEYSDAGGQDMERQLQWIDSVLAVSQETWKIVIGHHPIHAGTAKDDEERIDMQNRLDPILRKHDVDFYLCGHIHNFQHIRMEGSGIDYVVNTSASLSRKVESIDGILFSSPATGFSVVSVTPDSLKLHMLDKNGALLHTVKRGKSN